MKFRTFFPLLIQIAIIAPFIGGTVHARSTPCTELIGPLHNQVSQVKDHGGMWDRYERNRELRNHSFLAMRVDSQMVGLMFTLDYLCKTEKGIPFSDVAEYIVRQIKEMGEEGFIKKNVGLGHTMKDVKDWVAFGRFSRENRNRKLEFEQIKKTVEAVNQYVDRYSILFRSKHLAPKMIEETKALIEDIDQFHTTDPYIKQADFENKQVPHSSALSNNSDEM
ncbi:MAG: hypothetical protein NPINA01_23930 [Nitrospinaceae bacterium]|nr:MAG: hypothetical protein NPINA01_23930 [Nitrospinaceae bacterium]